jgi:hypothetical protein
VDAARVAIERAIKQGRIAASDVERVGDHVVVHTEAATGAARRRAAHSTTKAAAKATKQRQPKAARVTHARRPSRDVAPSATGIARAHKLAGNGVETKAAEDRYRAGRSRQGAPRVDRRTRRRGVGLVRPTRGAESASATAPVSLPE